MPRRIDVRLVALVLSFLFVACSGDDEVADTPPLEAAPTAPSDGRPLDVDALVAATQAYAAEHPDTFAGLFLDGGRVHMGFTADVAAHAAALQERVGRIEVFEAEWSERELQAVQARIDHDRTELARMGIEVSTTGVDVKRNRVEVGVRTRRGRAAQVLRDRYGADKVVVEEGVEVRPV